MTAKERAELVVAWIKKQEQENFYLGTLEMNLIAEFEAAEREAWNAAIEAAIEKMKTFGKPYWTREETIELLEGITQ